MWRQNHVFPSYRFERPWLQCRGIQHERTRSSRDQFLDHLLAFRGSIESRADHGRVHRGQEFQEWTEIFLRDIVTCERMHLEVEGCHPCDLLMQRGDCDVDQINSGSFRCKSTQEGGTMHGA